MPGALMVKSGGVVVRGLGASATVSQKGRVRRRGDTNTGAPAHVLVLDRVASKSQVTVLPSCTRSAPPRQAQ